MSWFFIPTPVLLSFMGQGKSGMKTRKQKGTLAKKKWQTETRQQDEESAGPEPSATLTLVEEFSHCRPCWSHLAPTTYSPQ